MLTIKVKNIDFSPLSHALIFIFCLLECGITYFQPNAKVINGMEAVPHSWPAQISMTSIENGTEEHECGGTIIG